MRITTSDINYINNLPVFYKQIFQACISTNKLEHRNIKSEYILLRQPIWHNIHIQYKRKTLYFKKLIEKNIIFIKDLKFVKGILDETYIYSIMGNKNCWMEVFQLKNALLKYKEKLLNFSESILSTRAPPLFITNKYTKEIYNIHVASVFIKPEFKILKCRAELENIEVDKYINIAFQNKVKYIDDRKLAEFNYKIINNILINKAYLSKWISETNANCSFCNQKEDTIHLLYDCSFNDHIWQIVGNCLQLNITYKHVVLGYSSNLKNVNVSSINYCITLISYLIYKYWLKLLNTNKVKNKRNFYNFLNFELNNRIKILQNTSEQTLHCCKKLTLILHELNLYIYLNYDPG